MSHIIFHVPHSSLEIPKQFWKICIKDNEYIKKSNEFLCDSLIDKLIPQKSHRLIFKYSRLFCDVERYIDNLKEPMFNKGMGVVYTNDCDNVITIINNKYKNKVLKSYYYKYHNKLDKIVSNLIKKNDKCTIIDFHSFSDEMTKKLFGNNDNPDICIGIDNRFTNKELINYTILHFERYGYIVAINKPYKGTIIPNKFINKNNTKLISIMIEINKRIYLQNELKFQKLKKCIDEYYQYIKLL